MSALVIFGFTVFHGALHYRNIIHSVQLLPLGLFIFAFGQSVLLSMRISRAFEDNELCAVELAERDRSRTTFFHNTSHELRTPLNGMIGFLELIQKNHFGNLPDRVHQQIDKSLRLAHSLKNQVNIILDVARSKRGELGLKNSAIDLDELKKEFDNLRGRPATEARGVTPYVRGRVEKKSNPDPCKLFSKAPESSALRKFFFPS